MDFYEQFDDITLVIPCNVTDRALALDFVSNLLRGFKIPTGFEILSSGPTAPGFKVQGIDLSFVRNPRLSNRQGIFVFEERRWHRIG